MENISQIQVFLIAKGQPIKRGDEIIGKGLPRSKLLSEGFTKKELDRAWQKNEIVKTLIESGGVQCFYYAPAPNLPAPSQV